MIQAFILSFLVLTNIVAVWHIIILGMFLGFVNAFDAPTRQSFIMEMIERKEDLGNAIALNSLMFNGARLLGPSIAGILISAVGEGFCFLLNVKYLAKINFIFGSISTYDHLNIFHKISPSFVCPPLYPIILHETPENLNQT